MSFPPEICLIGAQKSGTTTLAHFLDQHPQISVAKNKEPSFYTHNWHKGLAWYKDQFPKVDSTICIDASPSFTEAPLRLSSARPKYVGVPEKVASVKPESRFIYLLRDPVQRAYSGYWAAVRHGTEKRVFRDAVFDPSRKYLDTSDYAGQVELWLKYFPIDSFLFLLLSDLKSNPQDVVRRCFHFIGVSKDVRIDTSTVKNRSYKVSKPGQLINRLMLRYPELINLKLLIPQHARDAIKRLKKGSRPIPPMDPSDRDTLREYFREPVKKLEIISGLSLSNWY